MTDDMSDAEMDAIVAELERAGLVEEFTDDQGRPSMRLTEQGVRVGRSLALAGDDTDAEAVLAALLK